MRQVVSMPSACFSAWWSASSVLSLDSSLPLPATEKPAMSVLPSLGYHSLPSFSVRGGKPPALPPKPIGATGGGYKIQKNHKTTKPAFSCEKAGFLYHYCSICFIRSKCFYISNRLPVATEYETLHMLQISVIVAPLPLNE